MTAGLTNWGQNYVYQATRLHRPTSLDELRRLVARAPKIRVLATRHAFNDLADSAELVSLDRIDPRIEIDRRAGTVSFGPWISYGELALALELEGLALQNMASLPHISVAGAVATATHGSGDGNGNLATAVAEIELLTSDGEIVRVARGDVEFSGMVVSLGALGVMTRLTLDVQPTFLVRQDAREDLPWDWVLDRFDAIMAGAYSVSLFTDFGDEFRQAWFKSRVDAEGTESHLDSIFTAAPVADGLFSQAAIRESIGRTGVAGPWLDRLPHFQIDTEPSSGGPELQAEYFAPRRHAVEALRAVRDLAPIFQPYLMIAEIRTVAADDLWLSGAYGMDVVCIHFTWKPQPEPVFAVLPLIEEALAPFEARPHWGKLFAATAPVLEARYERLPDFRRLAERLDPRGAFRNAFLDRCIFG